MATTSGGVTWEATGTPINEAPALNLDARLREAAAAGVTAVGEAVAPVQSQVSALSSRVDKTLVDAKAYADGKVAGMESRVTAAERGAADAASSAAAIHGDLKPRVESIEDRQTALESAEGYGPSTPEDGQTASFILQPDTQTRRALDAAIVDVQTRLRPRVVDPEPVLLGIGDSLTHAWGDSDPWMATTVASLDGWTYENHGYAGQTAAQVAARMNAAPALLTFPDNVIPASGATIVTAEVNPVTGSFDTSRTGAVAGIRGTLAYDGTSLTFTRATDGGPVTLTGPAPFIADEGATSAPGLPVIWVGRNGTDDDATMAALNALVAARPSLLDKFVVIPPPNAEGWPSKNALRQRILTAYPTHTLDVPSLLQTELAAQIAGITWTSQDRADIAAGYVPSSFRQDAVHYNSTGRAVIGVLVAQHLDERGWATMVAAKPLGMAREYRSTGLPLGKLSSWTALVGPALTAASGAEPTVVSESGTPVIELSADAHLMSAPDTSATDQTLALTLRATTSGQLSKYFAGISGMSVGMDGEKNWNIIGNNILSSTTAVDEKWHTLVLVKTGTAATLYLDGAQILTGTPGTSGVAVTRIGGGGQAARSRFADVTQWKRALSVSEVGKYHAAVKERFPALALA